MTDPKRWIDDPSVADGLRDDLNHAVDHPPAPPIAPTFATPMSPVGPLIGLLALGLVGGAIALNASPDSPNVMESRATTAQPTESSGHPPMAEHVPAEHVPAERAIDMPTAEEAAAEEATEDAREEPAEEITTAEHSAQSARRDRQEAPVPGETATLADEIALMARIRRALEHHPSTALSLARRGERTFQPGMFREERRAMIVLSLARLGRPAAARSARAFLRDYPASTFVREIEEIVDRGEGSHREHH